MHETNKPSPLVNRRLNIRLLIDTDSSGFFPLRQSMILDEGLDSDQFNGVNLNTLVEPVTGEVFQGITSTFLTASYIQLNATNISGTTLGGKACWWYIKNTVERGQFSGEASAFMSDSGIHATGPTIIIADDGDQIIARLAPQEFMIFCSGDNTKIQAKADGNKAYCEYACFHMA
tara:strand:- start:125 stop:649 length:525 start_codon:yes stop_codon:yes gene_type:complete